MPDAFDINKKQYEVYVETCFVVSADSAEEAKRLYLAGKADESGNEPIIRAVVELP